MDFYLGVITKILDDEKFIVEVTVKGLFEALVAYPYDVSDQPKIKDPVAIYCIDSEIFGQSLIYQRLRLGTTTKISLGGNKIEIAKDSVTVETNNASIELNSSGDVKISSGTNINISSDAKVELEAPSVTLKTATLESDFTIPFVCPYTGQTHITTKPGSL